MRIERALFALAALCAMTAPLAAANPPGELEVRGGRLHLFTVPEFNLMAKNDGASGACGLKRVRRYAMDLDGDDHIVVPVMLDKPRLLIVDTGGVRSTLYESVAKEMKLAPPVEDSFREVGVGGYVADKAVTVPNLSFGVVTFHDATFQFMPDDRPLPLPDNDIAGTLGPTHLMSFDVEFDFHNGIMNLYAQDHCTGQVVYWAKDYVTVPFEIEGLTHITFPMMLDGKKISVMLDSGAPDTVLNMSEAKRLFGLDARSPGMEPIGYLNANHTESERTYRYKFKSLSMDGIEIRNPTVLVMPDKMADSTDDREHLAPMILGLRELLALHLYIAYGEHVLYATAAGTYDAPKATPP